MPLEWQEDTLAGDAIPTLAPDSQHIMSLTCRTAMNALERRLLSDAPTTQ